MEPHFDLKNTYDLVDKITKLVIHDEYLFITVEVKNTFANIDNSNGFNAVSEPFQFRDPLIEAIMQLQFLLIIIKNYACLFNGQCYIQATDISISRDWKR